MVLNIILGILFTAGLIWGFSRYWTKKDKLKGKPYSGPRPGFVGALSHKFPCALIATNRVVYSTHVSNGLKRLTCSFGTGSVFYIEDARLKMFDNGTDVALVMLDNPVDLEIPKIVAPKKGERVYVFTKDEAIETQMRRVYSDGKFQVWFNAQPGDSSAVVVNENMDIIGLITNQGGWGTNLSVITDRLYG